MASSKSVAQCLRERGIDVPKRSKYGAKRTSYNGVFYASKAEAAYAQLLDSSHGVRFWIGQPRFRLGVAENLYVADMLVIYRDGSVQAVDVKGFQTPAFKKNVRLWLRFGPCELVIIKGGEVYDVIPRGTECP